MNYILPFLAVALGAIFVLIGKSALRKQLPLLLAFSGAFLLATTITAVFPEVFIHGNGHISYWVLGGIVIQIALENITKAARADPAASVSMVMISGRSAGSRKVA